MFNLQPSKAFVEAHNQSSLELFRALAPAGQNFVCSPAGLRMALAMAFAAARNETEQQMAQVLRFPYAAEKMFKDVQRFLKDFRGGRNPTAALMANSAWCNSLVTTDRDFAKVLERQFFAQLESADFSGDPEAARKVINRWVRTHSAGHVPELIPTDGIDPLTMLLLVNVVLFKGKWAKPFSEYSTLPQSFHMACGDSVDVSMMDQVDQFDYFENEMLQAIDLPYRKSDFSLLVLLPRAREGLDTLESALSTQLINDCVDQLAVQEVELSLPRFKMETGDIDCIPALTRMGLELPFQGDEADFSGFTGQPAGSPTAGPELYVTKVIHQARIEVAEKGTTALAVSILGAGVLSASGVEMPPRPKFRANHPFVFALRQRSTGAIVFLGRVMEPERAKDSTHEYAEWLLGGRSS